MSDALIKAAVEAAEKAVAAMQVSVRVVAPGQTLPDPDKTRYEQLRKHLKGMQQGRLDSDYYLWAACAEAFKQILEKANNMPSPEHIGPARKRLMRPQVRPPRFWRICVTCNGTGSGDIGYCRGCEGNGYIV